ncbi:MAG: SusD/RagB family nutrient-binding outer membrane lipoprotein [Tannerellaceae bacterium]|nr:SusD/RagB family nutrient-binding outer membrane lipoprotein [Tannerellaceae bacterium]
MKKYINQIVTSLIIISTLFTTGCTDSFDDVNTNPDKPVVAPKENLFAYGLYCTSYYLYDRWFAQDEPMTFCGYVSKMSYIDEAKYQYRPGVQDTNWRRLYQALLNFQDVQDLALDSGDEALYYAAMVMEVHLIQIATDRWRDVPYSDAAKLGEGILTPSYDTQEEIYPVMLAKLKVAADGLTAATEDVATDQTDLLFKGDRVKWQKYCNSLRLRLAIRIAEVSPELAKTTVEEVLGNPSAYPVMESNDDNAFFWWLSGNSAYFEPIASAYRTRQAEYCAPDVMVDKMVEHEDPRIGIYFTPTPSSQMEGDDDYTDGTPVYRGFTIGAAASPTAKYISVWGYKYGQDLGGFSPYMRVAEVYFHIAEAAMLGYNTGGITAEDAYNTAIRFSMEENEVSTADAESYLAGAGKFTGDIKQLWYEEWVAMFKQAMEGWSLYRRTGIPEELYIAPARAAKYANHNVPPFRSLYPNSEKNLNGANNAPYDAEVVDDFWGKQMWWDTRVGVY